ncbi:uncharacterized protein LOC112588963 [Harpegnathos saltator]|uniref:uncharacterized protein LOC112588963 n=1 Tax=Harpegnathos saltator TaxID=610380 RepID=UPI000DBEEBC2|nr:uncharacterized protein LOC112588963 [Harpegnathos saltator]
MLPAKSPSSPDQGLDAGRRLEDKRRILRSRTTERVPWAISILASVRGWLYGASTGEATCTRRALFARPLKDTRSSGPGTLRNTGVVRFIANGAGSTRNRHAERIPDGSQRVPSITRAISCVSGLSMGKRPRGTLALVTPLVARTAHRFACATSAGTSSVPGCGAGTRRTTLGVTSPGRPTKAHRHLHSPFQ